MTLLILPAIERFISPQLVERLASALGLEPGKAQTLVAAALPTLLSMFARVASRPEGADRVSAAVADQTSLYFNDLAAALLSSRIGDLEAAGARKLEGLIATPSALPSGALARATGVRAAQAEAALALLTPAALAGLGRLDPAQWRDGPAIAALFAGGRDALERALPEDLAVGLAELGLTAPAPSRPPPAAARARVPRRRGVGETLGLVMPIAGLLIVIALVFWLFGWKASPTG